MDRIEPIRRGPDGVSHGDVPSVKRVGREQATERRQREKAARERLNDPDDRPDRRPRRARQQDDGDGDGPGDGDRRPSIDIRA